MGSTNSSEHHFHGYLKLYEHLLLDMQRCLQAMELESLHKHPCLGATDVAKRKCRDDDGEELGERML